MDKGIIALLTRHPVPHAHICPSLLFYFVDASTISRLVIRESAPPLHSCITILPHRPRKTKDTNPHSSPIVSSCDLSPIYVLEVLQRRKNYTWYPCYSSTLHTSAFTHTCRCCTLKRPETVSFETRLNVVNFKALCFQIS